jgi:CTP synthase (UTP-ammonia lyase)
MVAPMYRTGDATVTATNSSNAYRAQFRRPPCEFTGLCNFPMPAKGQRRRWFEIIELKRHPFFLATRRIR